MKVGEDTAKTNNTQNSNNNITVRKPGSASFRKKPSFNEAKTSNHLEIVYRDRYFCIVNKPAGIPVQTKSNENDILSLLSMRTNIPKQKMHMVNRLDQPVSGLMIIALSSEVHAAFEKMRKRDQIIKVYLAITTQVPSDQSGILQNHLLRDGRKNKSYVVSGETPGNKAAKLSWYKLAQINEVEGKQLTLLAIRLNTGRHHQIRVQLTAAGWPIWGDRKYGNDNTNTGNIALISYCLRFSHPISKKDMNFCLKNPGSYPFSCFPDKDVNALLIKFSLLS